MTPDPELFRLLFEEQGEPVRWFPGVPCPCYRPQANEYSRNCPNNCHFGHIHTERTTALNGQPLATYDENGWMTEGVKAVIQNKTTEIVDTQTGMLRGVGDATIMTMPDEIPLSRPDYFLLQGRLDEHKEVLKRGTADRLSYPHAATVIRLIAEDGTALEEGVDFTLNTTTNSIEFLTNIVAIGDKYAVYYQYHPRMWFNEERKRPARPTKFGARLPVRGVLSTKHPSQFDSSAPA